MQENPRHVDPGPHASASWPRLRAGYRFRWRVALQLLDARRPEDGIVGLFARAQRLASGSPRQIPGALEVVDGSLTRAVGAYLRATREVSLIEARWNGLLRRDPWAPGFACDGSLGGLARWLRAAGLRAEVRRPGVHAAELIRECVTRRRILLTTDTTVLRQGTVRDGDVPLLWLPSSHAPTEQLRIVLRDLDLAPTTPLCMACGGELVAVDREAVLEALPPRTARWKADYWRCATCGGLFWQGTHWDRIRGVLEATMAAGRERDVRPSRFPPW
jgi:uncharacterized protein with PIN domain